MDDGVVVGCTNPFSGRVIMDGEIKPVQQGSTLYSHENYRKDNVGGELFLRITMLHPSGCCYFSGISQMAIGLYRVLKYTVFEFPRMIYLRKCRSVVQALLKTESAVVAPLIWVGDLGLWLHRSLLNVLNNIRFRAYKIEETTDVPQEVVDIIQSDTHPFAELHDKAWFEWNLNYKLTDEPRIKRLFLIRKGGKIEAFFMTKEQFFKQASSRGFKNVNLGTVVEWGIASNSTLTEEDVYLMSLNHFSPNIDGIQYATTDDSLARRLKKWLFVGIGTANVGIRFKGNKDSRIKDIKNWRIRLAAGDTLLN
jgi:hypothetical protein